ncbi:MAG: lysine exporter LysO family protein [Neisseria sp.]|nr:lysine exporter LysO family protein [Neisseria sp.]
MQSLSTIFSILAPLFAGYFIRIPKPWLRSIDRVLDGLIYLILALIGVSLSQVSDLGSRMGFILGAAALLFVCLLLPNLLLLAWFDKRFPFQTASAAGQKKGGASMAGSAKQIACLLLGLLFGWAFQEIWLPPENSGTYALMLLMLFVGIQLGGNGVKLRTVLINRRGVQTALLGAAATFAGGLLFALLMPDVAWSKGLALASGFGWYSLSGIVMTEAYGAVWGSVALINDLAREFFALVMIPPIMRRYPSAAVNVGGATSLDFTLPVIQSAGGLAVVPLAVSYGFIINLAAPFLMVLFSSL